MRQISSYLRCLINLIFSPINQLYDSSTFTFLISTQKGNLKSTAPEDTKWCNPRWWLPLQTRVPIFLTGFYSWLSQRTFTYNFISLFSQTEDTLFDSTDSGTILWRIQKVRTYYLTSRSSEDYHIQDKEKSSKDLLQGHKKNRKLGLGAPGWLEEAKGGCELSVLSLGGSNLVSWLLSHMSRWTCSLTCPLFGNFFTTMEAQTLLNTV